MSLTYGAIAPNPVGLLWSEVLELYLGIHAGRLRYFEAQGQLVPTPEEDAEQAQQQVERLAEQLRSLGIEPEG